MTHCVDFFRKWKVDENFCGVGPANATKINKYILIVNELAKDHNVSDEECYTYLPTSAIFNSGFLGLKPDSKLRREVITKIIGSIKTKTAIRQLDMRQWTGIEKWTDDFVKANCDEHLLKVFHAGFVRKKKSIETAKTASSQDMPCSKGSALEQPLERRIANIKLISSVGQLNILQKVITEYKAKDLYDAYCMVLAWSAEFMAGWQDDKIYDNSYEYEKLSEGESRIDKQGSDIKVLPTVSVPPAELSTGMKVRQIKGQSRAYGVGVIKEKAGNKFKVQFAHNLKVLSPDEIEVA